jgi:hypothetical protein
MMQSRDFTTSKFELTRTKRCCIGGVQRFPLLLFRVVGIILRQAALVYCIRNTILLSFGRGDVLKIRPLR